MYHILLNCKSHLALIQANWGRGAARSRLDVEILNNLRSLHARLEM